MTKRDYYEVLGIPKNANDAEVKKAYRRAAQKHHPDRNIGDDSAVERFKEAKEAYEVLSDPTLRARYNSMGHAAGPRMNSRAPSFEDIIRAARDHFHASESSHPSQLTQQIGVPIDIMLNGGDINVQIMVPTSTGQYGQIRLDAKMATITIAKDTAPGTVIKQTIAGQDLTLVLVPQSSGGFIVHGIDIVKKIDISVIDALVGTTVEFTHLDGTKLKGTVPPGVESGTPLRIPGRGLAHPMNGRGDLILVINHVMPVLNEEQLEIVKELAEKLK